MPVILGKQFKPAFEYDFVRNPSLTPLCGPTPVFSAANGNNTYFNSSGVLTTAGANQPRFNYMYNGSSWIFEGMLFEKQKVQYAQYTENIENASYYIPNECTATGASGTWIDGNNKAIKLVPSINSTTYHGVNSQAFTNTTTAGMQINLSIFAKAAGYNYLWVRENGWGGGFSGFNLTNGTLLQSVGEASSTTIIPCGNGWYRLCVGIVRANAGSIRLGLYVTATANRPDLTAYAGDGTSGVLVCGSQIEPGLDPTSYIPNNGSGTVTRSADSLTITGSDFTNLWNTTEGCFVVEYDCFWPLDNNLGSWGPCAVTASGTSGNAIYIQSSRPSASVYKDYALTYSGGVQQAGIDLGSVPAVGTSRKIAFAFKANDFAASINGGAVVTDTSGSIPTVTGLTIGGTAQSASLYLNGHIKNFKYYRVRPTNQALVVLST